MDYSKKRKLRKQIKRNKSAIGIVAAIVVVVVIVFTTGNEPEIIPEPATLDQPETPSVEPEAIPLSDKSDIQFLDDGTPYLINPNKISDVGPAKDSIPSIDDPKFVSVAEADRWINEDELGMAIIHKDAKRFYPFQILVWHEIVNDNVAGDPVLVTYCPLCGSGIAFERKVDDETVEFGTSGKLYNSNLVMYDRKTGSYWTQIGGLAIIGPYAGRELKLFPADVTTWSEWKTAHPDSKVLSRETGHVRAYGNDPYGNYYTSSRLIFPVEEMDSRLHEKTVIFGVQVNGIYKAYQEGDLKQATTIYDTIGDLKVRVERDEAGIVKFINTETGERIPHERDFWFAWFAFHPDTELYER